MRGKKEIGALPCGLTIKEGRSESKVSFLAIVISPRREVPKDAPHTSTAVCGRKRERKIGARGLSTFVIESMSTVGVSRFAALSGDHDRKGGLERDERSLSLFIVIAIKYG